MRLELGAVNATPQTDGLSPSGKLAILSICCMSLLIVAMDNTIVNVALPSIRRDLHASLSGLQWIIDAYTLVLASLLAAVRLDRRQVRAQADLPDGPCAVRGRLAAVQRGADARTG